MLKRSKWCFKSKNSCNKVKQTSRLRGDQMVHWYTKFDAKKVKKQEGSASHEGRRLKSSTVNAGKAKLKRLGHKEKR